LGENLQLTTVNWWFYGGLFRKGVERESALMAWSTMSYRAPDSSIITEFGLLAATAGDLGAHLVIN
jgi:hypothetical protein